MISENQLLYLCDISQIFLSEAEIPEYQQEMNCRISYFDDALEDVGDEYTEDFPSAPYSSLRGDTAEVFEDAAGLISLAPSSRDNMILMPKVVD